MTVFTKIEAHKEYKNKILLISEEEKSKRNVETLSALELYHINEKRFVLMRNILKPILNKLQQEIPIKNIYFTEENEDDLCLNIEISQDEKDGRIILDNSDYDDSVEFVLDSTNGRYNKLIKSNQKLIIGAFKDGIDSGLNVSLRTMSTSKEFLLIMNLYKYFLENKSRVSHHYIKMLYQYFRNDGKSPSFECSSDYLAINDLLQDSIKLKEYLSHIKFYESDIPRELIKKR